MGKGRMRNLLAEAAGGFEDHGEDAGLVSGYEQRDVAVDGDLGLEQLLAGCINVGGIGEGDVPAHRLFDDDARGGVAQHAEVVGVHLDRTSPEELLHAAADGGVEGAAEQGVGGGIGKRLLLLLGVKALLILSAAEGQQGNHVGLGQGRIAAVGDGQLLGGSVQAQGDFVVLDASGGVEVDGGFNADRVGKEDVATLEIVAGSGYGGGAFGDGDAAQQRGRGDGAAQAQVHVASQFGVGVLEVQLGRGNQVDVKADVIGGSVWRGEGLDSVGLRGQGSYVQVGTDREAGDEHIA